MHDCGVTLLGDFVDPAIADFDCSLTFTLKAVYIEKARLWKSKDLSAEFFGEFWNNLLDIHDVKPRLHFICAELLENAVYHSTAADYQIMIQLCLKQDELLVYVRNSDRTENMAEFKDFIHMLLEAEDLQDLFIQRMKEIRKSGSRKSQVGLITIVKDRGAQLAWKLEEKPDITLVTTLARIPLKGTGA